MHSPLDINPRSHRLPPWDRLGPLLGILAVVGYPFLLPLLAGRWELMFLAGVASVLLLVCGARLWRVPLIGPLFYYEVVRLGRRGRSVLVRTGYALLLLGALWVASRQLGATDSLQRPDALARIAPHFVTAILLLQITAVYLLTPVYLCGAIAEERERGSLDLLLTTSLRDREIVVGKLLARVAHVGGVLLAGLPVLCLVQLWGGIEPRVLLVQFTATTLPLLSVGCLCVLFSTLHRTRTGALVTSYGCLSLLFICCFAVPGGHIGSPLVFLQQLDMRLSQGVTYPWYESTIGALWPGAPGMTRAEAGEIMGQMLGEYAAFHVLVALLLLAWAVRTLRRGSEPPELTPQTLGAPPPPAPESGRLALPADFATTGRLYPLPPIGDNPLLWKESEFALVNSAGYGLLQFLMGMCWCVLLLCLCLPFDPDRPRLAGSPLNSEIRALTIFLGVMACLVGGFRAAGVVSRERQSQTLDSLLLLPLDREEILRAKWLGVLVGLRPLGYALAGVWVVGLATRALHPLSIVLLAAEVGSLVTLVLSAGLWLSVVCRSTLRAQLTMAALLAGVFVGPWLLHLYGPLLFGVDWSLGNPAGRAALFRVALNPIGSWWAAGRSWSDEDLGFGPGELVSSYRRAQPLILAFLTATLAWVFWRFACWGFSGYAGRD